MGGAGRGARRIEAVEAAVGFHRGRLRIERGMQIRETFEIARDHLALPTAAAVHGSQALIQQFDEIVHVGAADVHRRRDADHVAVQSALADQQAVLARGFHHLRGLRGGGRLGLAVLHQFDGLHEAHAADVADDLVLVLQFFEAAAQVAAGLGAVVHQLLFFDVIDHGFGGGGGHGIAAEGGDASRP